MVGLGWVRLGVGRFVRPKQIHLVDRFLGMGLGYALQKYQVGSSSFWWHSDAHGDVLAQGVG